jgi:hypothetical protein
VYLKCGVKCFDCSLTGSVALGMTQILPSLLPITANSASLLVADVDDVNDVGASEHQIYSIIIQ